MRETDRVTESGKRKARGNSVGQSFARLADVSVAGSFSKKVPTFLAEDSYETNEPERRWRWNWLKAEVDCGNVREKGGLLNSRTEKSRTTFPWPRLS